MEEFKAFAKAAADQVETVVKTAKTASVVIFVCGCLVGCTLF